MFTATNNNLALDSMDQNWVKIGKWDLHCRRNVLPQEQGRPYRKILITLFILEASKTSKEIKLPEICTLHKYP